MAFAAPAGAHVVEQFHAETVEGGIELLFDVGYADPQTRDDPFEPQPTRDWLVSRTPAQHEALRRESAEYVRHYLGLDKGAELSFPDFDHDPADFERLLSNGAYYRIRVPLEAPLAVAAGSFPDLAVRLPDDTYRTLKPGDSLDLGMHPHGLPALVHAFREGFVHVLPAGLDHILFILAIFLLVRKWRPLLWSSLAFTIAHTITLGLGAAGVIAPSSRWVEPAIALSIAALAIENLLVRDFHRWRLAVIFGFGLVHGMGFASVLAKGLGAGDGFAARLVCANLGVEAAQVAVLSSAWVLTLGWGKSPVYPRFRTVANLALAAIALAWFVQRLG
ncbi:HupE/UreJ family protein [Haloferula sargassicola]|uniref:HupE/UreJ family protein n=1 Tax=Haloferula sargassicola TaxID=490096 RepID=UPI0033659B72